MLPFSPVWLKPLTSIKERYNNKKITYSTVVITVQNKELAETIIIKGLYFKEYNHTTDRF
jgi:hypothetical protein